MLKRLFVAVLMSAVLASAAVANGSKVLVTINQTEITEAHLNAFLLGLPRSYVTAERRPALLAHLMDQELLAQRMHPFRGRYALSIDLQKADLAQAYFGERFDAIPVSEEDLVEAYTRTYGRHAWLDLTLVTVPSEETAQEFARLVSGGQTFAEAGRALGVGDAIVRAEWLRAKDMDPAILRAAIVLPGGQITGPVRSRQGWHVVRTDQIWHASPFSFQRDNLEKLVRFEAVERAMQTQENVPGRLVAFLENETRRALAQIALEGGESRGAFFWRSSKRYLEEFGDRVEYLVWQASFDSYDAAVGAMDYIKRHHRLITEGFEPEQDFDPRTSRVAWVTPAETPQALADVIIGAEFGVLRGPIEVDGTFFLLEIRDFRGAPSYFYDERLRYFDEQPEMRSRDISDVLADFRRDANYRFDDSLGLAAYRSEKLPFRALFDAYQTPAQ